MIVAAVPSGFALSVPPSWYELDLHPQTRTTSIDALVRARLTEVPELAPHRAALTHALRGAARTAHAHGAVFCGVLAEGFDTALLTATMTVSVVNAPGEVTAVGRHLRPIAERGADRPWRVVEEVELPHIGAVTRTRGVEDVPLPDGTGWVRTALLQTFVPFPGAGPARVALITGTSPALPLAAEMHDLFDAVTTTFRFL
jgi:hypothetical protein